ncbi:MAG: GntR family transcriptional regulator [Gammaproteobacteria bacterium]|nr:GntR family transcriptional regulator [Gammaproteobacteria bacterium]
MLLSVDLYNAKPAYLQITDAVRQAIATGSLRSGDRLPPIREAAIQTRVNRNTVSRAYLELEHQGLVHARQGSGVFVTRCGAEQEKVARRKCVLEKIGELLTESRLSQLSTEQLLRLIETEARKTESTTTGT